MEVEKIVQAVLQPRFIRDMVTIQVYEELLHLGYFLNGLKPVNILEIGARGGTFYLFHKLSTGKKVAVDTEDKILDYVSFGMMEEDFHFIQANSQTIETFQRVKEISGSYDFIFIDGDHSYEGVKRDFELYKELLSPRGWIAFHDIDKDHVFTPHYGPNETQTGKVRRFWEELDYGSKTEIVCQRSTGISYVPYHPPGWDSVKNPVIKEHYGGIGLWRP